MVARKKVEISVDEPHTGPSTKMSELRNIIKTTNDLAVKRNLTTSDRPLILTLEQNTHIMGPPIPTGNPYLDFMFRGGWPRGCWSKHWGPEGGGKSAQAMSTAGAVLGPGEDRFVLWIQAEDGDPAELAKIFGIDVSDERFIFHRTQGSGEQALEGIKAFLVNDRLPRNLIDLVVIDSLAGLDPSDYMDASTKKDSKGKEKGPEGTVQPGRVAAMYAHWFRNLQSLKALGSAHGMMISQARAGLDPYGPKEISVGGKATNHAARLILKYRKVEDIKSDSKTIGHSIAVTVQKDGYFSVLQNQIFEYDAYYGHGFDKAGMYFEMLRMCGGLVESAGSRFTPCDDILKKLSPERVEAVTKMHGQTTVKKELQDREFFFAAKDFVTSSVKTRGAVSITNFDENDQGVEEDDDSPIPDAVQEYLGEETALEEI